MRRMAYATGAVLIAALAAGCTSDSGSGDSPPDSKPGTLAASSAPPGKYRTLPDACRAIPLATLKDLLPGTADMPDAQQEKVFEGAATVTYDTDRRIGCRWKSDAPEGTRSIHLDFERVVSYDTSVSDDDRARGVYAKKEAAADLPDSALPPGETPDASRRAPGTRTPARPAGPRTRTARRTAVPRTAPTTRKTPTTRTAATTRPPTAPTTPRPAVPPTASSPVCSTSSATAPSWTTRSSRPGPRPGTAP